MKRLDVTIQSFLWGNQVQGKESEIVAAIEAQRQNLSAEPTAYTVRIPMYLPPINYFSDLPQYADQILSIA